MQFYRRNEIIFAVTGNRLMSANPNLYEIYTIYEDIIWTRVMNDFANQENNYTHLYIEAYGSRINLQLIEKNSDFYNSYIVHIFRSLAFGGDSDIHMLAFGFDVLCPIKNDCIKSMTRGSILIKTTEDGTICTDTYIDDLVRFSPITDIRLFEILKENNIIPIAFDYRSPYDYIVVGNRVNKVESIDLYIDLNDIKEYGFIFRTPSDNRRSEFLYICSIYC